MLALRRLSLLVFVVLVVAATAFIIIRAADSQQAGQPVAFCPGPDQYGYVCAIDVNIAYVDAVHDTGLYADDGLVQLELPFTFTFYGTAYDALLASSNGNLQFTTESAAFANECLVPGPAPGMGDMIAPYWDDLDLSFEGFLETEVVGQAPERIFVVEWDNLPRYGASDDRLTFEVQLFEGSNDIVFLYQDTRTLQGVAGSQATIGLQSQEQGYALQVSCNQYAVFDGSQIQFVHPAQPADDAGVSYAGRPSGPEIVAHSPKKGRGAAVAETLNERGRQGLDGLRATWLNQRPPLESAWLWADLDGDLGQEMVILWYGAVSRPDLVELAVLDQGGDGRWAVLWQSRPLARQERLRSLSLVREGDLTGDGAQEVLLRDPVGGALLVLMARLDGYHLIDAPGRCNGPIALRDADGDRVAEIVLGGCPGGERWTVDWDGRAFTVLDGQ